MLVPKAPSLGLGEVKFIHFNIYEAPIMCWTFTDIITFHSGGRIRVGRNEV